MDSISTYFRQPRPCFHRWVKLQCIQSAMNLMRCTVSGGFVVKQGIPNRNGVRKHLVIDAPVTVVEEATEALYWYKGSQISFLEGIKTRFGRPLYAERGDSFIISLRIEQEHKGVLTARRTGHVELSHSVWAMMRTKPCQHHPDRGLGQKHKLDTHEVALAVQIDEELNTFLDHWEFGKSIYLSTNSLAARWRALIAVNLPSVKRRNFTNILRTNNCCCPCAIEQAGSLCKPWCLVL